MSANMEQRVIIRQTDIHPYFKQMMSCYITHFCSVQWKTLLNASNLMEAELPPIQKYMMTGRNNLCYAYILRKWQGPICGKAMGGGDRHLRHLCTRTLSHPLEHSGKAACN
jgi:hypothetical protein